MMRVTLRRGSCCYEKEIGLGLEGTTETDFSK